MQWTGEVYGGFSKAEPWLPMSAEFRKEITVEAQEKDRDSILSFYKKLVAMRKRHPVIAEGEISFLETGTDMALAYKRVLGEQQIVVLCNLDRKKQSVKTDRKWAGYKILLENYPLSDEVWERALKEEIYTMEPYEFLAFGNADD